LIMISGRRARMITVTMILASLMLVIAVSPSRATPMVQIVVDSDTTGGGEAGSGSINFLASYSNSASGGIGAFTGTLNDFHVSGLFSVDSFATPLGETFFCGPSQTVVLNGMVNSGNFTGQGVQVTGCVGVNSPVMILIAPPSSSLSFSETYFGFGGGTVILQH
jgi:hypothetical protein